MHRRNFDEMASDFSKKSGQRAAMTMRRQSYKMPGGFISALHFGEDKGPVRLVFAHANGFNALSYRAIFKDLDIHAIAIDMRGHGFTDLPTDPSNLYNWDIFANDITTFVARYVPGKIVLSGHSFGAASAILAAPQLKDRLAGYVGFDPVTVPFLGRHWSRSRLLRNYMKDRIKIMRNAGQRRRNFENHEEAFKRYHGRGAFKSISDAVLRDYLDGGLLPDGANVRLACEPLWEQAIFAAQANDLFSAARHLPEHSRVHYAGRFAVSSKATRAALGSVVGTNNIHFDPTLAHMFPLQSPEYAVRALSAVIGRV